MKNEFLTQLEKKFYVNFNDDNDRYVLDKKGNVVELYLDGVWKIQKRVPDPKHISDLSIFLPLSPHLKILHINNWAVEDMSPLEHFTSLEELSLSYNNHIAKICGLEKLTQLKTLDLSGNKITKIEGLDTLEHLKTLNLHSNSIKKVENINKLFKLQNLLLAGNEIHKLEGIEELIFLKKITIGYELSDIPNLDYLPNLQEVGIEGNINKLNNLYFLPQLQTLVVITETELEDKKKLLVLNNLKNIRVNGETLKGYASGRFFMEYN